jgi:hypothetical protein
MAEHSTTASSTEAPDAFFADRQRTWAAFTNTTVGVVIFVVLLLVAMAVFLL